jgi:hypothetical protein
MHSQHINRWVSTMSNITKIMARHSTPSKTRSDKPSWKALAKEINALQAHLATLEVTNKEPRCNNQELNGMTLCSIGMFSSDITVQRRPHEQSKTYPMLRSCLHLLRVISFPVCMALLATVVGVSFSLRNLVLRISMGSTLVSVYVHVVAFCIHMMLTTSSASYQDHHATCWV